MRFVITGEWSRNSLLRLVLALFLVYVMLFVVTSALMYFDRMGLDPASVVTYFNGDPGEEFGRPPKPYGSLVETSHQHLFAMGMLVMVLAHLLLFVPVRPGLKVALTVVGFGSALLSELSNWLVRFVSPAFAAVKVGAFLLMEVSLTILVLVAGAHVLRPTRNAYKDTAHKDTAHKDTAHKDTAHKDTAHKGTGAPPGD